MKKITNIKQISSNKYSLLIDDKKHIVYDDVLLKYNILKTGEISEEIYIEIVNANNYYEGYNKCLKYILAKKRTEKEIREKLIKLSVGKEDIQRIIERLYQEHYLDDDKYISSYINDNLLLTLNGPKKIALNLKKSGLKENLVNEHLIGIDDAIWSQRAEKILNKKLKTARNISKKMFVIKLKKDFQNLGYDEKYYNHLLKDIIFDDADSLKKDYDKIVRKLSRKYSDEKLNVMVKQKLYQLGYTLEQIEKII